VEEALTPFGILGHGGWLVSRRECTVVKCVNIGNVEDYPPPPGTAPLGNQKQTSDIGKDESDVAELLSMPINVDVRVSSRQPQF